ncbi:MAG: DUF47 family protein [Atopobiaceae bacterium]|nr:DUF47 family protein [Atopobiaceae bacterium]
MSRVSRKEDQFYDMLLTLSKDVYASVVAWDEITRGWPETRSSIHEVKALEIRCDMTENAILDELNTSFITPFDREDLDAIAREMGEVGDLAEGTSARYDIFDVHVMIPEAAQMTGLVVDAMKEMVVLFEHFHDFKKDPVVKEQAKKIGAIEDEGDIVYRNALGRIFNEPDDPIHVLKWKSLLDPMERTLDYCKTVANVVLSVVMKNA